MLILCSSDYMLQFSRNIVTTCRNLVSLNIMTTKLSSYKLPSALSPKERLIWVDCEMTGLNVEEDKLLEIAVIVTEGDTLEVVGKTESIIIHEEDKVLDNMNEWCIKQHGASGLTQACKDSKISCAEAEQMVLSMLKRCTNQRECPLAGNSVGQDRK